ncbi:hypothetical protein WDU94_006829 [Cyamophila willieti]
MEANTETTDECGEKYYCRVLKKERKSKCKPGKVKLTRTKDAKFNVNSRDTQHNHDSQRRISKSSENRNKSNDPRHQKRPKSPENRKRSKSPGDGRMSNSSQNTKSAESPKPSFKDTLSDSTKHQLGFEDLLLELKTDIENIDNILMDDENKRSFTRMSHYRPSFVNNSDGYDATYKRSKYNRGNRPLCETNSIIGRNKYDTNMNDVKNKYEERPFNKTVSFKLNNNSQMGGRHRENQRFIMRANIDLDKIQNSVNSISESKTTCTKGNTNKTRSRMETSHVDREEMSSCPSIKSITTEEYCETNEEDEESELEEKLDEELEEEEEEMMTRRIRRKKKR